MRDTIGWWIRRKPKTFPNAQVKGWETRRRNMIATEPITPDTQLARATWAGIETVTIRGRRYTRIKSTTASGLRVARYTRSESLEFTATTYATNPDAWWNGTTRLKEPEWLEAIRQAWVAGYHIGRRSLGARA